jgi:hypothetical protein
MISFADRAALLIDDIFSYNRDFPLATAAGCLGIEHGKSGRR